MTKLNWGAIGDRYFETGVDRGVLYVGNEEGVPWNGLVSVTASSSGGEAQPYYIDGFKYANVATAEEFEATIVALTSPSSFDKCDGTGWVANGLSVTEQPRKPFNFCYRSKVGNDIDGVEHGYKLHLVYNALAKPSERSNATIGDSTEPMDLSWAITTRPVMVPGMRPTSHLIVDSRFADETNLAALEELLYGGIDNPAMLPTIIEVISLFA